MNAIAEIYTFHGPARLYVWLIIAITLAACVAVIYQQHLKATQAIQTQYEEYKKYAKEKRDTTLNTLREKSKNKKSSKGKPTDSETNTKTPKEKDTGPEAKTKKQKPPKETPKEHRLQIRNEEVEKATISAVIQCVTLIIAGFLLITILGVIA